MRPPSAEVQSSAPCRAQLRPRTAVVRPQRRLSGDASGEKDTELSGGRVSKRFAGIPRAELDRFASLFIHLGDRVTVAIEHGELPLKASFAKPERRDRVAQ